MATENPGSGSGSVCRVHDAATRNSEQEVRENFLEVMRSESEIRGFRFTKF